MQGINIIKDITNGNSIVQQKDINWSNRTLGYEALTHINMNINIHDFIPKIKLEIIFSIIGSCIFWLILSKKLDTSLSVNNLYHNE